MGAIAIIFVARRGDSHRLHVADCEFVGNRALGDGGAVYTRGGILVENSAFIGNEALGNAGAVRVANADAALSALFNSVVFTGNKAARSGGAAHTATGAVDFTDCTFKTNHADAVGGAVASLGGDVTDARGAYESNAATKGGAVAMTGGVF